MSAITVELNNAEPDLTAQLTDFVVSRELGPGGIPATVLVGIRPECDTVGAALAEFVAAHPGPYEMFVEGPAASTKIFQLHTIDDTNVIVRALAMCSGLL